nr:reverse transcriptase domain-containing protein [Tanacetum cinerariifolium]
MNTASSSGSGTLPGNTITNPKEHLKGITTRSETAYQGPTLSTTSSSLPKVVEHEPEVTKGTVPPTNNESTKDIQPSVVQTETPILNSKTAVAPIIEPIVTLDKLYEQARTPLNKHCLEVLLKKLPEKLGDPGKFLIPCDFPGMAECVALVDFSVSINLMPLSVWNNPSLLELSPTFVEFDADPQVPLILKRSFLKTKRALIDVFEGELTLQYSQEVLGFSDVIACGNPTPYSDLTVSTSSPTLTLFRDSDFLLKEVNVFLALEDDPTSSKVDESFFDPKGDILLLESFLNDDDPSLPPPTQGNYLPQVRKKLKIYKAKTDKYSIDEPPKEKSHFMVKKGIVLGHKISKNRIEVDKAKVDVIGKLPYPTTVKCIRSFLGHGGFYRQFIKDFSKIARPMTHLLEKDTPFFFSKECVEAFQTLKRKLIEALILIAPDWICLLSLCAMQETLP